MAEKPEKPDKIEDFGQKIGGARKDLNNILRTRDIAVSDTVSWTDEERVKYITKKQVWREPDFAQMVKDGLPVTVAYFIKHLRDSLAAKPSRSDQEYQEGYIRFIADIRDHAMTLKTEEDCEQFFRLHIRDVYCRQTGYMRYAATEKAFGLMSTKMLRAATVSVSWLKREVQKKHFLFSDDENIDADYRIAQFDGENIRLHETGSMNLLVHMIPAPTQYNPDRRLSSYYYPTRIAEETKPFFESMDSWKAGSWFVVALRTSTLLAANVETEENARKIAKNHISEQKKATAGSPRKTKFMPQQLGSVERNGSDYREGKDVSGQQMLDVFGFYGGEFGNWESQNDRQFNLNYAYDAFRDLAIALDIDPQDISLGGKLSIAFGARGHGSALAHFEPDRNVINLTKMKGAGSLAHEWGHAFDHFAAKALGLRSSYASHGGYGQNPDKDAGFTGLVNAMLWNEDGGRSEYYKQSKEMDRQYSKDSMGYWSSPIEMFARAFACYVMDKLAEKGVRSDYLTGHAECAVFPSGEERTRINEQFDLVISELKNRGILHAASEEEEKIVDTSINSGSESQEEIEEKVATSINFSEQPTEPEAAESNEKGSESMGDTPQYPVTPVGTYSAHGAAKLREIAKNPDTLREFLRMTGRVFRLPTSVALEFFAQDSGKRYEFISPEAGWRMLGYHLKPGAEGVRFSDSKGVVSTLYDFSDIVETQRPNIWMISKANEAAIKEALQIPADASLFESLYGSMDTAYIVRCFERIGIDLTESDIAAADGAMQLDNEQQRQFIQSFSAMSAQIIAGRLEVGNEAIDVPVNPAALQLMETDEQRFIVLSYAAAAAKSVLRRVDAAARSLQTGESIERRDQYDLRRMAEAQQRAASAGSGQRTAGSTDADASERTDLVQSGTETGRSGLENGTEGQGQSDRGLASGDQNQNSDGRRDDDRSVLPAGTGDRSVHSANQRNGEIDGRGADRDVRQAVDAVDGGKLSGEGRLDALSAQLSDGREIGGEPGTGVSGNAGDAVRGTESETDGIQPHSGMGAAEEVRGGESGDQGRSASSGYDAVIASAFGEPAAEQDAQPQSFAEWVNAVIVRTVPHGSDIPVGETPEILQSCGCRALPVMFTRLHMADAMHEKSEENPHYHGLTAEQMKQLPVLLAEPAMIFDSISNRVNGNGSILIMTGTTDSDHAPLVISIKPNGRGRQNGEVVDSNFITSMYGKEEHFDEYIDRIIANDSVLYFDRAKMQALFDQIGMTMPEALASMEDRTVLHTSRNIANGFGQTFSIHDDINGQQPISTEARTQIMQEFAFKHGLSGNSYVRKDFDYEGEGRAYDLVVTYQRKFEFRQRLFTLARGEFFSEQKLREALSAMESNPEFVRFLEQKAAERREAAREIRVGDRFRLDLQELTVTSLEGGLYPDDVIVQSTSETSTGAKYTVTKNISKNDLLDRGEYLGNAAGKETQLTNEEIAAQEMLRYDTENLSLLMESNERTYYADALFEASVAGRFTAMDNPPVDEEFLDAAEKFRAHELDFAEIAKALQADGEFVMLGDRIAVSFDRLIESEGIRYSCRNVNKLMTWDELGRAQIQALYHWYIGNHEDDAAKLTAAAKLIQTYGLIETAGQTDEQKVDTSINFSGEEGAEPAAVVSYQELEDGSITVFGVSGVSSDGTVLASIAANGQITFLSEIADNEQEKQILEKAAERAAAFAEAWDQLSAETQFTRICEAATETQYAQIFHERNEMLSEEGAEADSVIEELVKKYEASIIFVKEEFPVSADYLDDTQIETPQSEQQNQPEEVVEEAEASAEPAEKTDIAYLREELMRGSGFANGKFRIQSFYLENHPAKAELAKFLKDEYGIGGHSGRDDVKFASTDGKGIRFDLTNGGRLLFGWNRAAEEVTAMIEAGQYITEKDIRERISTAKYWLRTTDPFDPDYADIHALREAYETMRLYGTRFDSLSDADRRFWSEQNWPAPQDSPWGTVERLNEWGHGIFAVETASGGGVMIPERLAEQVLSPEAIAVAGEPVNGYYCFKGDAAVSIAALEMLDKGIGHEHESWSDGYYRFFENSAQAGYPAYMAARTAAQEEMIQNALSFRDRNDLKDIYVTLDYEIGEKYCFKVAGMTQVEFMEAFAGQENALETMRRLGLPTTEADIAYAEQNSDVISMTMKLYSGQMIIDDYTNGELNRTETTIPDRKIEKPVEKEEELVPDMTVPEKLQSDYDSYLAGLNEQGGYMALAQAASEIAAKQGILAESGRLPVLTEEQRIALVRMDDLLQTVYDRMQDKGTSVIVTVTDLAIDLAPAWKEDIYSYDKLPWYVRHYAEAVDVFMRTHNIDQYRTRFQNGMDYAEAIANSLYHTGSTEMGCLWLRDTYHGILNESLELPDDQKPQVAIDAVPLLRRLEKFHDGNGQIHAFAEALGFTDEAMHDYFEHDTPKDQMNLNGYLDTLRDSCNLQIAKQFLDRLYGQDMPIRDVRKKVDGLLTDFITEPFDINIWVPDDLPNEIVPLYTESFGYAQENMEVDQYRASGRASHECVTAITEIGQANYHYPYFDPETTYSELLKRYDPDRIAYIMAYSVSGADWDRRYDDRVREWAAETLARLDVKNRTCQSCPTLHPGLMNSLAKHIIAVEQRILNPEKPELASMPGEPLNIPIEVIENILRSGGSHPFSDEHIIIGLSEKKTDEQKADFLREEFGIGARGIFFGETRYAAFFDESGITVSQGMRAFSDHELHISWQEAAERTELMLDIGSFASPEVILHVPTRMREELAREIIAQQRQFGGNYFVEPHYFAGTETQTIQLLSRSLEDAAFIRELTERLQNPRRADQAEIFIPKLETAMFALSVELTTREGFAPVYKQFVTDDEKQLRMTELADSGQFDDFYGKDHTMTEKAEFLKTSLGTGSRTGTGWNMEYSTDGIRYAKTGKKSTVLATAHISWSDAAAMIEGRMSARIAEIQSIRNDADYYNAQLIADLREGDLITFGGMTYKVREIIGDYMCTIEPRNPDGSLIPGISEAYQTLSGNWRENLLGLAGSERILREEPVSRTYLIFQMKKDEALHYYRFEPLDSLKKQHFPVDFSNYDHVYSGDLNDIAGSSLRSKLDMIYQNFNLDHPADFTGHSLSVGDIIVVTEAGQETAYFVDSVSFVSVPEFLASRDAAISETATKDKIASDGISETDDLKAGDHIRFDGKEWVVESIDGDFYISLQNLDPKDNMQKRGMTNWKKHLPDIEKIEGFGIPGSHKSSEPSKPNGRSEAEGQLGLFDFTDTDETTTEEVDTSINSENVTASEMTESAPAAVDESAEDAQHTEVLEPAPALTLEKELYRSISEKFPKVLNGEHTYEQYGAPDDGTDIEPLSIKARGGNEFELTVFSMQDNVPMNNPQYVFTVNAVSGTVQALEYRMDGDSADTSISESVILPDGTVDFSLQLSIEQAMRQTLLQMDVLNRPLRMYSDSEGMHTVSVLSDEKAEAEVTAPVSYDENAHLRGILNEFSAKHGLGALDVSHDHDRVYRLNEVFADGEEFTLAWIYGDYYAPVLPEETLKRELENLEGDCARRGEPVDEMRGRKVQAEAHGGITPLPAAPDELPEIRYADNPQQRIYANLSALRELARLERAAKAGRPLYDERPTQYHSKQNSDRTLREYVGWGGLPQVFDESFGNLGHIRGQLRELMTPEEYENARASTLTAFYTPQVVIDAMYKALRQMDLPRDCRILEPACGTGNFITRMPHSLGSGGVVGIELDSVTARIATYLASGRENVTIRNCGFEESGLANDSFDLAIGNIPFGEFKLRDPDYAKDWLIHDAFFRKALDKVAPGGVVAFITSSGTLDKKNPRIREYLAERADLIGAIRLPNNAFSDAGTAVTSDIIFLQKREHLLNALDPKPAWCYTAAVTVGRIGKKGQQPEQVEAQINQYFIQNPQMILGTMMQTSHYDMLTCMPVEGVKLSDQLDRAIHSLHAKIVIHRNEQAELARQRSIEPWGKDFTFQIQDGKVYFRIGDTMQEVQSDKRGKVNTDIIRKLCELRDVTRELLEKQQTKVTDEELIPLREKLNELYDAYFAQYGSVNSTVAKTSFGDDADYPIVSALETKVDDKTFVKSEIFTKRTVNPYMEVQSVDSVEAALQVSLDQRGKVSIPYMAALLRHSFEEQDISHEDSMKMLVSDLLEKGVIFRDPEQVAADDPNSGYVDRAEYLSGNVRRKLVMAEAMAQMDPEYLRNTEALREVLPVDIPAAEISVSMGAPWIDVDDYKEFLRELSGRPSYDFKWEVLYSSVTGEYSIPNATSRRLNLNPNESNTYGTADFSMYALAQRILNQRRIEVKREVPDPNNPGKTVSRTDVKATKLANEKAKIIRQKFQEWLFATPERKAKYEARYNQLFNSLVGRSYDGSGLTFKGMTVGFELKQHQLNCIARTIYGGNTLAAHVVGAGKSAVIAASVMKKKELGLIHKACLVVPKPLTEQAQREWRSVFPDAKLLVVSNDDLSSERKREIFTARVATGDYDCVIMSQQQFEKLGMSKEYQLAFLEKERDILLDQIEEMKRENPRGFSVKQIEKMLKDLENRIKRITAPQSKAQEKDSLLDFETLGFDYLVVDEAHAYKNGFVTTKMTNVAGVTVKPSGRAQDMQMKCDYFNETFGDGHILFATGTPVSNSMTELYVMNRYLRPDLLQLSGTARFDDWAATFGNVTQQNKLTATGQLQLRTSFSSFKNMPELMAMYKEFADLITADRLPASIKRPELIGGEAQVISVDATPEQKAYVRYLADRALACQLGQVRPTEDNPLKITREARLVGMGNRAIAALYRQQDDGNGELPDGFFEEADSKIDACIAKVLECYEKTKEQRGVQIIFSDIAVNDDKGNFSAYKYIRDQLIAAGIPAEEIVFAPKSDAKNREDIFRDINEAKYRVVIASTGTLGTGANIQKHLYALHHLDIPWKPSDFEQREGRILRQGNEFEAVEIFNYVTKGTLDSFLYQIVKDKARYIAQLWNDECPARVMEDCDETVLHYGHFQAAAEDNPHLLERLNLQSRIDELKLLRSEYRKETTMLQRELARLPQRIEQTKQRIEQTKADIQKVTEMRDPKTGKVTSLTVRTNAGHGDVLTDRAKINAYLNKKVQSKAKSPFDAQPGITIGNFTVTVEPSLKAAGEFEFAIHGERDIAYRCAASIAENADNCQRLMNFFETAAEKELARSEQQVIDLEMEMEQTQERIDTPFPHEEELSTTEQQIADLDAELAAEGLLSDTDEYANGEEDNQIVDGTDLTDGFIDEDDEDFNADHL